MLSRHERPLIESSIDRVADLVKDIVPITRQRPQKRRERLTWHNIEATAWSGQALTMISVPFWK